VTELDPLITQFLTDSEKELSRLRRIGFAYKFLFLSALFLGVFYAYTTLYPRILSKRYTPDEGLEFFLFAYAVVAIPLLVQSVFTYLPAKYLDAINLRLKQRIVQRELTRYKTALELHPDSSMDDELLFDIGLLSDTFKFAYGDDYLYGTLNGVKMAMSEFHIRNLLWPLYNGFVGEIHLPAPIADKDITLVQGWFKHRFGSQESDPQANENEKLFRSWISECESIAFIAVRGKRIYLGVRGNKDMFEFSFAHITKNNAKYASDCEAFSTFMDCADRITKAVHS